MSCSLSENTLKAYQLSVESFEKFRQAHRLEAVWPPPLSDLVNFLAYLSIQDYSYSSASLYMAGINFYCKVNCMQNPTSSFLINKMLKGFKRSKPARDNRVPITLDVLKKFPRALQHICFSVYETKLYTAMFTLAFFAFLRIGEIATVNKGVAGNRVVQFKDLEMKVGRCVLKLRYSKTDQFGKTVNFELQAKQDSSICPIACLQAYLRIRPSVQGPLFCHYDHSPVTKSQFSAVLSKACTFLGLAGCHIKCHSFRIGAATTATLQGVPDQDIKRMGRWSEQSAAFKRYVRLDVIKA